VRRGRVGTALLWALLLAALLPPALAVGVDAVTVLAVDQTVATALRAAAAVAATVPPADRVATFRQACATDFAASGGRVTALTVTVAPTGSLTAAATVQVALLLPLGPWTTRVIDVTASV
jgi:hypothetical protein